MASIYCYSYAEPTLNLLGVVDDFISFNFTRSYSGIGEWQLVLDGSTLNAQRVKGMNFISLGKNVAGYVAKCEDNTTAGVNTVTFTGVELKGLTQRRIIIPPTGQAYQHYAGKSPEYIIAELLNLQLLNPTDIDRQIVGSLEPYETEHSGITYDGRYQVLADEIVELATAYNIGWCASIEDGAIVWRIWNGVNRTAGQTENNRMILDYEYGTMNDSTLTTAEGVPTFMIVAGQGEGAERAIETLNNGKAKLERQETFLDARDIEDDSLLAQRGEEKLAEYGDNTSYTATLSNQAVKQYRTDFDLGDIGTIREAKIEGSLDYRITEVEEVYEGNQVSINVVFGYEKSQFVDAIKRMNSKRDALLAVEGYGSGSSGGGCDCEPITTSSDGEGNVIVGGGCVSVSGSNTVTGDANIYIGSTEPTDDSNVWIDTDEPITTISGVDEAYVDYKIATSLTSYAKKDSLLDMIYPVGSIYMSSNQIEPSTIFGGVWERIQDQFLLSAGSTYAAGSTGGEATHTLTTAEMPSHRHNGIYANGDGNYEFVYGAANTSVTSNLGPYTTGGSGGAYHFMTAFTGSGSAHNNMPPYLVVYMWKRTA